MTFLKSFHNHTTWSDGLDDMGTLIRAARDAGIREFGVSDHWTERPDGIREDWSMPLHRLDDYIEALLAFRRELETDSFKLLIGLEVDYFEENAREVAEKLRRYPVDYLIGSVHFAGTFSVDHAKEDWDDLPGQDAVDAVWHTYWKAARGLCASGLYDIIGHLDLPKKFGFRPAYDDTAEAYDALRELAKTGKPLELNTAGRAKSCAEFYPAPTLCRAAHRLGIPFVLSTDCHDARHLARFTGEAGQFLETLKP